MGVPARLIGFAALLVAVFALAFGIGAAMDSGGGPDAERVEVDAEPGAVHGDGGGAHDGGGG